NIILILESLVLLWLSSAEIRQVRRYAEEVKAAQELNTSVSHQFAKIATRRGGLASSPPPDRGLEDLRDLSWAETSRWIVCGAGAALLAAGIVGLIGGRKSAFQILGAS